MTLTFPQLNEIMKAAGPSRVLEVLGPLQAALEEFEIRTSRQVAHFLAQLAHESGEFRYKREIASGEAYEGREYLGNTEEGDGPRFKGWGWMQTTGRGNTRRVSLHLYGDARLIDDPTLIDPPEDVLCARSAGYFWRIGAGWNLSHRALEHGVPKGVDLNDLAEAEDLDGITLAVNGGLNGLAARHAYLARCVAALPPYDGRLA